MQYTLTPGYIDVDYYGWELHADDRSLTETHDLFATDQAQDIRLALDWADQILGKHLTWARVEDPGHDGYYGHHYAAEA